MQAKLIFLMLMMGLCWSAKAQVEFDTSIVVGAERTTEYFPDLKGKRVAVVANQSSRIGDVHLVDSLLSSGIQVKKVYALEHGFRGTADAGEHIKDSKDTKTGLPIVSLHGKSKRKPTAESLADVDVVIFDIQDVGVRFYTYISSLHYIMEAVAEENKTLLILDRPNPNGYLVDGPVLDPEFKSFVGMHPIPVAHGMTIAEYAQMINGEGWLKNAVRADIKFVKCLHYEHRDFYRLPVRPSPNLPNMKSILLYPSLCFFEGTQVSIGRGTPTPFQLYGYPNNTKGAYSFTPVSTPGASKYPKHQDRPCKGVHFSEDDVQGLVQQGRVNFDYLFEVFNGYPDAASFFLKNHFIDLLAGTDSLRKAIMAGMSSEDWRKTWEEDLQDFKAKRKMYLLYE